MSSDDSRSYYWAKEAVLSQNQKDLAGARQCGDWKMFAFVSFINMLKYLANLLMKLQKENIYIQYGIYCEQEAGGRRGCWEQERVGGWDAEVAARVTQTHTKMKVWSQQIRTSELPMTIGQSRRTPNNFASKMQPHTRTPVGQLGTWDVNVWDRLPSWEKQTLFWQQNWFWIQTIFLTVQLYQCMLLKNAIHI